MEFFIFLGIIILVLVVISWYKNAKIRAQQKTIEACKKCINDILNKGIVEIPNKQASFNAIVDKVIHYIYSNKIYTPSNFESNCLKTFIFDTFWLEVFLQSFKTELWNYFDVFNNTSKQHIQKVIDRVAPILLQNTMEDVLFDDDEIIALLEIADKQITRAEQENLRNIRYSLTNEYISNAESNTKDYNLVVKEINFNELYSSLQKSRDNK